ncbi:MAG: Tfp pilus assembly protein FimT/FimU, partial [Desulfonatronovibrio sp.]
MSYYLEKEHRNVSCRGVTLIELMVVIGLMAILMAIAIPRLGMIKTSKLNGAARVVWSDMHHAKMTAIKENRSIKVNFSEDENENCFVKDSVEYETGYCFVSVDEENKILFSKNLTEEYSEVILSNKNGVRNFNLIFTAKGTMNPPSQTIRVTLNNQIKQFTVLSSGRIGG